MKLWISRVYSYLAYLADLMAKILLQSNQYPCDSASKGAYSIRQASSF